MLLSEHRMPCLRFPKWPGLRCSCVAGFRCSLTNRQILHSTLLLFQARQCLQKTGTGVGNRLIGPNANIVAEDTFPVWGERVYLLLRYGGLKPPRLDQPSKPRVIKDWRHFLGDSPLRAFLLLSQLVGAAHGRREHECDRSVVDPEQEEHNTADGTEEDRVTLGEPNVPSEEESRDSQE